jgi:hypothetical protein
VIVGKVRREAQRYGEEPAALRREIVSRGVGTANDQGEAVKRWICDAVNKNISLVSGWIVWPMLSPIVAVSRCLLRVISRHNGPSAPCPLRPQKRTFVSAGGMSEKCQEETFFRISIDASGSRCACGQRIDSLQGGSCSFLPYGRLMRARLPPRSVAPSFGSSAREMM